MCTGTLKLMFYFQSFIKKHIKTITCWRDPTQVNDVIQVSLGLLGLRQVLEQHVQDLELAKAGFL